MADTPENHETEQKIDSAMHPEIAKTVELQRENEKLTWQKKTSVDFHMVSPSHTRKR